MAEILLTHGAVALIDDADLPLIQGYRWYLCWTRRDRRTSSYAIATPKRKTIYMHRLIFGAARSVRVDHINRNSLDNRRFNLRACTVEQNNANRTFAAPASGYRGVRIARSQKFQPVIMVAGRKRYGQQFADAHAAAAAYDAMATELLGEFAVLNFPRAPSQGASR